MQETLHGLLALRVFLAFFLRHQPYFFTLPLPTLSPVAERLQTLPPFNPCRLCYEGLIRLSLGGTNRPIAVLTQALQSDPFDILALLRGDTLQPVSIIIGWGVN